MKKSLFAMLLMLCPLAVAQVGNFSGPSVLTSGSGSVGQRSGQDVDLRFFVNATGVYDTGITPYAVTSAGTLVTPSAQYGVEAGLGAYGRHTFRRSVFGLDYSGNFRHYPSASNYDGSNQQLGMDYIYQKSRRLLFSVSQSAGTQNFGTTFASNAVTTDSIVDSSSLLFDNRTNFYQGSMNTSYALTGRTSIVMGGSYYTIHRQSRALVGVNGYNLRGTINHQLSRSTIVGASFQHTHFDFPRAFGESDINMYTGQWSTVLGRSWKIAASAGVFMSQVQGVESTALDPAIAQLLGISTIRTIFYRENIMPMGTASLTKSYRRSSWGVNYSRFVSPGNGLYLTSRQESYGANYSYTGLRRLSFSANGGVSKLGALGQSLVPYTMLTAGANLSYNLGAGFNVTGGYARRHQDIQANTFRRDSSRVSIGIYFSPGSIPISFH